MLMNLFGQVWTPYTREPSMVAGGEVGLDTVDSSRVMAENQLQMQRHREIGLPIDLLQRFRVQEGVEGGVHPFQCTQS
jgi:WD and tetratricopeptide repeat-containing protein 1